MIRGPAKCLCMGEIAPGGFCIPRLCPWKKKKERDDRPQSPPDRPQTEPKSNE